MKKSLVCTALIILGLTSFSMAKEQVELFPEVKALITPKPLDPKLLENSYSVGLLGLLYPTDDYYEIAKQTAKTNYEILMDKESSKKLITIKNQLPEGQAMLAWSDNMSQLSNELMLCSEYMSQNCVQRTIENRAQIEQLWLDNHKLLQRYRDIVNNTDKHTDLLLLFSEVEPYDFSMEIMDGYYIRAFVIPMLNKVILQLNDLHVEQAIDNLQVVERSICLLTPDDETVGLLLQMMAVAHRSYLDSYLNTILDAGLLTHELNNPDVVGLSQPYPNQYRHSIVKSIEAEQKWVMNHFIRENNGTISNEALNQIYLFNQRLINTIKNNTFTAEKERLMKECDALNVQYNEICNVFAIEDYLARYDTQSNYHNMVYLKYLILKDNIQDQDISEFLKSQGDIAIDQITQAPFQWNPETRVISIPLPESKYLPSQIRMAVMKNPDIKNLQVTIPKRVLK